MRTQQTMGFTLLEIMIVVTIIGILSALAIPGFTRLRESSTAKIMVQEGRQIAGAAQQYFMESGGNGTGVAFVVDPTTGIVTGPLTEYLTRISPKLTYAGGSITGTEDFRFSLSHSYGTVTFNMEGKPVNAEGAIAKDVYNQ